MLLRILKKVVWSVTHDISWPVHDVSKDVDSMVEILSEVEDSERGADVNGPVLVVCR